MSFSGDFVRRILRPLDEEIAASVAHIANGMPSDWAAYREAVGEIRALRMVRGIVVAELARVEPEATVPRSP